MSVVDTDWNIRKAEMSDLYEVKKLADSHKKELGFVLQPVLARSISQEQLFVAVNGESVIGFIQYHHRRDSQTTLHNIVVESNYRKLGIGQELTRKLETEARCKQQDFILLKCPVDLSANSFYKCIGYEKVGVQQGKARQLNIWRKGLGS